MRIPCIISRARGNVSPLPTPRIIPAHPSVMPDVGNPPSVMPDIVNPPSVIPDVINRESMVFPCRPTQIRNKKNTGFPLTTGGHDRGGPAGMTKAPPSPSPLAGEGRGEGVSGHDKGPRAGIPSCPTCSLPPSVMPDVINREPMVFPCRVTRIKEQKRKILDSR